MEKINTIQKREKLNDVYAIDEVGPGGANHKYAIIPCGQEEERIIQTYKPMCEIQLQCGPRKEEDSQHGLIDGDLLEIVRHRLQCFQAGPFASEYNAKALEHIEML